MDENTSKAFSDSKVRSLTTIHDEILEEQNIGQFGEWYSQFAKI